LKAKWWDQNPNAADCPPVLGDDESGGISIYNIGWYPKSKFLFLVRAEICIDSI